MNIIEMLTLFGIMATLAAVPSASVALVVTRSATLGVANGIAVSLGIVTSFLAGFFLTLDVKAIIFYVSLLPIFIDLSMLYVTDIFIIISVMVVSVGGVKVIYVLSATKVACFARHHQFDHVARKTAGSFMLGAGGWLLFSD